MTRNNLQRAAGSAAMLVGALTLGSAVNAAESTRRGGDTPSKVAGDTSVSLPQSPGSTSP